MHCRADLKQKENHAFACPASAKAFRRLNPAPILIMYRAWNCFAKEHIDPHRVGLSHRPLFGDPDDCGSVAAAVPRRISPNPRSTTSGRPPEPGYAQCARAEAGMAARRAAK